MRYTRGLNLETGEFEGIQDARAKRDNPTDKERYSHIFNCLNENCSAKYHWRKAIRAKENTGIAQEPATFIHNYKFPHIEGCRYAYQNYARQHREVSYDASDMLNLRLSFPIGAAIADLRPDLSGMLPQSQIQAANDNIDKMGFNSLRNLIDFIEKKMGGLNDPMLGDLNLFNQGIKKEWGDLWTTPIQYARLLEKSQQFDAQEREEAAFTLVRPTHKGRKTEKGNIKFICEPEHTMFESKLIEVRPILVCFDERITADFERVADRKEPVLVASRPVQPVNQYGKIKNIYLSVASTDQLARVDKKYWRPVLTKDKQLGLDLAV